MTSIDENAALDHAYFQALEKTVIRLRGTPLLLSPADWQIAKRWRQMGIPLSLTTRILEEVFSRASTDRGRHAARSLRYCSRAVEDEWNRSQRLAASGARDAPPELDLHARLGALADALPEWIPNRSACRQTILGFSGSANAVESKLAELDNKLMASVLDGLDIEESREFKLRAESALESLRPRLSEEEAGKALTRLVRQMVRRSKQMPLLSLFSPEADSNPVD